MQDSLSSRGNLFEHEYFTSDPLCKHLKKYNFALRAIRDAAFSHLERTKPNVHLSCTNTMK